MTSPTLLDKRLGPTDPSTDLQADGPTQKPVSHLHTHTNKYTQNITHTNTHTRLKGNRPPLLSSILGCKQLLGQLAGLAAAHQQVMSNQSAVTHTHTHTHTHLAFVYVIIITWQVL